MSGDDQPEPPSLDPRSWVSRKSAPEARDAASFDPKTWAKRAAPDAAAPPAPKPPGRRSVVLAVGAVAVVAAAGAGSMLLRRPAVPKAVQGAAPRQGSRRATFTAEGLGGLQAQLADFGAALKDAATAADAVRAGFPDGGKTFHVVAGFAQGGRLQFVEVRRDDGRAVRFDRVGEGFSGEALAANLTRTICGTPWVTFDEQSLMRQATFYAAATPYLDDDLIDQFVQVMSYDFNLAHDLWPGSQFRAKQQRVIDAGGNLVGRPQLVMAELTVPAFHDDYRNVQVPAKAGKYYLFDANGDGHGAWFDDQGQGAARSLMQTPVDGARITSGFGYRQYPVFDNENAHVGKVEFHKGVDFACKIGTTVYAGGDGVVERMATPEQSGGYGNFLVIRHSPHLESCYGHLSGFWPGLAVNMPVVQRQPVALSGNTGNSTGPHVHFEIRVDGQATDPLKFTGDVTARLAGAQFEAFKAHRDAIDAADVICQGAT